MQDSSAGDRLIGGRFLAVRPLKCDQGVDTFLGDDLPGGGRVVIKTIPRAQLAASVRARLEQQVEILRGVVNPSLAPFLDLGFDADRFYLVRSYVPGSTLEGRLAGGPLSTPNAIGVLQSLLEALKDAHQQGVLHGNVKPSNVILRDAQSGPRVAVVDFGPTRAQVIDSSIGDQPVACVRYLSPEQAGLIEYAEGEWSDLYAAGVLLFECLAGRPLFEGEHVGEVLRQHLTVTPRHLRSFGLPVPRALDEVTQRLLRKDPRERYQSAEAVLADLGAIADALARGVGDPAIVVGARDRRRVLGEPAFVGRTRELAALEAELERAARGEGGLVLVEAESGGGKTRLMEELAQRGLQRGAWILRGQALDQAAERPFQMLAGVAGDLLAAARREPGLATSVASSLGEQGAAVCAALPELAEVLRPDAVRSLGPEVFAEARSLDALTALVDALGSPERPALILLDDGQWADEMTVKLLAHCARRPGHATRRDRHAIIVVAYRSEEVPQDHALRRLRPTSVITLPLFGPQDLQNLVESMAGPLPADAIELTSRLSLGSPFMATAVLRGLVESGALLAEPSGWRVEPRALAEVKSSRHAAAILTQRLKLLPPEALRVLSAAAVLGKEFELHLAAALAGETSAQALRALDEAARRRIVWSRAEQARYAFVHDKLREALLALLPADERQELHHRAALRLEEQHSERVFDLAYHLDAAGEVERALPYALAAAEEARSRNALAVSEQHYRIARRGTQTEPALRRRIAEGLGDVLMLRGCYAEAAEEFEAASLLAGDAVSKAQIEGKKGELAVKRGDVKTASQAIERALRLLGRSVPHRRWMLGAMAWEVLVQLAHAWLPRLFVGRRRLDGAEVERVAVRLYNRLAYAYWFQRGAVPTLWAHLRGMNLAERYPPTPELAQAYSEHAPVTTQLPYFRRGIAYAEKSLAIRTALGDLWGQGQSLHFLGVALYGASRYGECIEKCRQAVRLLERTGDLWEMNTARWHIAFSLYRLGELRAAVEESRRVHELGQEIGDHQAAGISLGAWAKASNGRVPATLIRRALELHGEDVHTGAEVLQAEGVRLLGERLPAEAVRVLEQAHRMVATAGVRQEYVSPVLPWLATALRETAQATPAYAPERRRALLRRAARAARRGLRLARHYQNNLPHALREMGLVAAVTGRPARARRFFMQSLAVAERQGARYEHALTRLAHGEVGQSLGWAGTAEVAQAARRTLRALGVEWDRVRMGHPEVEPVTLSLADRFASVLEAGRRIASAIVPDAVFAAVRDAATMLLRGEECVVVEAESDAGHFRSLISRACSMGKPALFTEGPGDDADDGIILSGVKSALAAPIHVRGRVVACLLVTHKQVAGLFGADEVRLAAFTATLAGAALENAQGLAEIEALSRSLEQRVAERTAELTASKEDVELGSSLLRATLESTADGILVVDERGRMSHVNRKFVAMWRIPESILESRDGHRAMAFVLDQLKDPQGVLTVRSLEQSDEEVHDILECRDGRVFERYSLPQRLGAKRVGRVFSFRDITERKRVETELAKRAAELARSNAELEQFAYVASHDLQEPLRMVTGYVELLQRRYRGALDPDADEFIGYAVDGAIRMQTLVQDLLGYARIGTQGRELEAIDGEAVLIQAAHQLRTALVESAAQLTHDPLPEVLADPVQLVQVFQNLIANAIKFRGEDAPRVHTSVERRGQKWVFSVRDNGIGIKADYVHKLFVMFKRLHGQGEYAGSGIGLAICKKIIERHGGRIWVESEGPGRGSTFLFTLPAVSHADATAERSSEEAT